MRLIDTVIPVPPHAIVSPVASTGKMLIRTARWPAGPQLGAPAGTVVICTGRSEFIEKYFEVVEDLRRRGLGVVVFEWRGQGLSGRLLRNPTKGHVGSFVDYERDLDAVVRQVLEPFCPRPWFGLAHSMGAPITLHYAARRPDVFRRLVLSAPMIEIARLPLSTSAPVIARWAVRAGLGRSVVPARRHHGVLVSTFDDNLLTSDLGRFERTASLLAAEPRLGLGLPTFRWLDAAFDCMAGLRRDSFIESFRTPTLVVMPGQDRVVGIRAAERLVASLRASEIIIVRGARHEVLMERDTFRRQFWSAFDAFIPGTQLSPARHSGVAASAAERGVGT